MNIEQINLKYYSKESLYSLRQDVKKKAAAYSAMVAAISKEIKRRNEEERKMLNEKQFFNKPEVS